MSSPPRKVRKYEMDERFQRKCNAIWSAFYPSRKHEEFSSVWSELRSKGELCDCEIESGDGHVYAAHRVILAGASPYFKVLFTSSLSRKCQRLELPEASSELLAMILDYAYTGNCPGLSPENADELLVLADRFELLGLVRICEDFLEKQLRPDNCLGIHKFAKHYFCKELERRSRSYVLRHFEQIVRGEGALEFRQLECDEVEELLRDDKLNAPREELVFEAVKLWLESATVPEETRDSAVRLLWACPRYGLMGPGFVRESVLSWLSPQDQPQLRELARALQRRPSSSEWRRVRAPYELLLLVGGWTARSSLTNLVETYDARSESWHWRPDWADEAEETRSDRAYHGLCCLENGLVYLCGGYDGQRILNTLRCFTLGSLGVAGGGQWRERACMHEARCYVSLCALGGRVYALGGNNGLSRLSSCERYEPAQNQWQIIAPMHQERSDASAAVLSGRIYVAGGYDGRRILDSLELYDPRTDQWTWLLPSMLSPRTGLCLVSFRHSLYAIGGFDGYQRLASVERLDCSRPRNRCVEWERIPDMSHPRSNLAAAVLDERILVIGGYDGSQPVSYVEAYSAKLDRWCDISPLTTARSALAVCVLALPTPIATAPRLLTP